MGKNKEGKLVFVELITYETTGYASGLSTRVSDTELVTKAIDNTTGEKVEQPLIKEKKNGRRKKNS